jgi:NADPH:quinone reductase-like Zn-dependent oxidoreductase
MMKAMVYYEYGSPDVLELLEIEKPAPKEGEVLVKVHAASVNPHDWYFLTGTPYMARLLAGLLKPKDTVLGVDVAGRVEAVGANGQRFQPGDDVFGMTFKHGAFAEYLCVPQNELVSKPPGMSFEEAAAAPLAGITALQGLRDHGRIQHGQEVLINGASGGVGTFAVQIAKAYGAHVTAVCSTKNLEMVRSLGADQVVDYTEEDFTQTGQRYDLIFDAVRKRSFAECRRALGPQGIYITTEFSPVLVLRGRWILLTGSQKMVPMLTDRNPEDLVVLRELLDARRVTPVIDRRYQLHELPEALRYIALGHAQGKVVITM